MEEAVWNVDGFLEKYTQFDKKYERKKNTRSVYYFYLFNIKWKNETRITFSFTSNISNITREKINFLKYFFTSYLFLLNK